MTESSAQNQITIQPHIGLFPFNSENTLKLHSEDNYIINYGCLISYANEDLLGHYIQFDYSYTYSALSEVLNFLYSSEAGPEPLGSFYSNVSLSFNTIDLQLKNKLGKLFLYGIGPSFSVVNRSVDVDFMKFRDRLASFDIGINGSINTQIPFSSNVKGLFFNAEIKLRYLHGLFYDKKGRDLSNYHQNFITLNLMVGIGYTF